MLINRPCYDQYKFFQSLMDCDCLNNILFLLYAVIIFILQFNFCTCHVKLFLTMSFWYLRVISCTCFNRCRWLEHFLFVRIRRLKMNHQEQVLNYEYQLAIQLVYIKQTFSKWVAMSRWFFGYFVVKEKMSTLQHAPWYISIAPLSLVLLFLSTIRFLLLLLICLCLAPVVLILTGINDWYAAFV